jgi:hypothetical protein
LKEQQTIEEQAAEEVQNMAVQEAEVRVQMEEVPVQDV